MPVGTHERHSGKYGGRGKGGPPARVFLRFALHLRDSENPRATPMATVRRGRGSRQCDLFPDSRS